MKKWFSILWPSVLAYWMFMNALEYQTAVVITFGILFIPFTLYSAHSYNSFSKLETPNNGG